MVRGLRSLERAGLVLAALVAIAAAPSTEDEKAIRAAAKAYVDALARGDAKALAALWTDDGDIVDEHGTVTKGRDTAALAVPSVEGESSQQVDIAESSLRMLTPDCAIEDGTVRVVPPGGTAPLTGHYTATWVREAGGWKIAGLREYKLDGGSARLADLDWMVGDWTVIDNARETKGNAGAPVIEVSVRWNATKTFLLRDMKILQGGTAVAHVTQRIGWDPLSRQLRSWVFDATGAHGEGVWSKDGDAWVARTTAVQPDGTRTSTVNVYLYDGKGRCTWQSFPTHAGGEHVPPVTMTMIRKPGAPSR
jgi:uncharacterized protein (TIGR02246 family)